MKTKDMTYAEWYQTVEKSRLDAIQPATRYDNARSHRLGMVDDCGRCIDCEIAAWNAWQRPCPGR